MDPIANKFGYIPIKEINKKSLVKGIYLIDSGGITTARYGVSILNKKKFLYQAHTEVESISGALIPLDACLSLLNDDLTLADDNGFGYVAVMQMHIRKDTNIIEIQSRDNMPHQYGKMLQGEYVAGNLKKGDIIMYPTAAEVRRDFHGRKIIFVHIRAIMCKVELDNNEIAERKVEVAKILNKDMHVYR